MDILMKRYKDLAPAISDKAITVITKTQELLGNGSLRIIGKYLRVSLSTPCRNEFLKNIFHANKGTPTCDKKICWLCCKIIHLINLTSCVCSRCWSNQGSMDPISCPKNYNWIQEREKSHPSPGTGDYTASPGCAGNFNLNILSPLLKIVKPFFLWFICSTCL